MINSSNIKTIGHSLTLAPRVEHFRLNDGTRFFQSFISPLQGFYPDEIVPADYGIENKFDDNISSTIAASVIRYGDDESYQQYLLNQVERSGLPFASRMTGKWSKYSTVSLQITTSN